MSTAPALYPTPWTVGVRAYTGTGDDGYGNVAPSWGPPVDTAVYAWAPAGTAEPGALSRDEVTWDLDLYAPPAFAAGPRDLVIVNGAEFNIEGMPEEFDHGPFGFAPGQRLRLRRVEG